MSGAGGQTTLIVPSHDLVVVRLGHYKGSTVGSTGLNKALALLMEAVPRLGAERRDFAPIAGEIPSPLDPPPGCAFHPRCPLAVDRCRGERPTLRRIAPGRTAACHLV